MWKILLVTDSFIAQKQIIEVFKGQAVFEVVIKAEAVLEHYRRSLREKESYDVILLDLDLAERSGLFLIKQIRALEREESLAVKKAVVVISLACFNGLGHQSLELGANDYVTKPIEEDLLLKKIEREFQAENKKN